MNKLRVSVVVVSRHRPQALQRCILGLTQQDHQDFEVVVVADPDAADRLAVLNYKLKLMRFDKANISAARNLGLAHASGEIVAFIDDDAVPEPTWLTRLCAPFGDLEVVAATGFIRGRNGISYQWKACEVDDLGQDHPVEVITTSIYKGTPKRCVKTQGTNCAFRRKCLCQIGGFDESFRFYLDEADVNLRMANLGTTAVVPDAQVHHGYEASERRNADRVPLSLFDIASSTAIFLRKHAKYADLASALQSLAERESIRIKRHRAAGNLTSEAEIALHQSLLDGWAHGSMQPLDHAVSLNTLNTPFVQFSSYGPRQGMALACRPWRKRKLIATAKELAQSHITTVFCLSPTARAHRLQFDPAGFWIQTGGVFGRSDRVGPRFQLTTFRRRVAAEADRLAKFRPMQ